MDLTLENKEHIDNMSYEGLLSQWRNAVRLVVCPHCRAKKGYHCVSPTGRLVWPPHSARITKEGVE